MVPIYNNSYDLQRFKCAQDLVYHKVTAELASGQKLSHWIWFIFPQIKGLGRSTIAQRYSLVSVEETRAYLADPLLSGRLLESCQLLLGHKDKSIRDIMGNPDDLKLCSSMTLFSYADESQPLFTQIIDTFYSGKKDRLTLKELSNFNEKGFV